MHLWFLGEMRQTIARSSTQYTATIPRRRNGETQHEAQRRDPMIPSDKVTLPEKTAQRYVFLGRPRRVQIMQRSRWVSYADMALVHHTME
jgi:hypothetical protein